MPRKLSERELYESFLSAESYVNREYKAGRLDRKRARAILDGAKKGYRSQAYNRGIEELDGQRN